MPDEVNQYVRIIPVRLPDAVWRMLRDMADEAGITEDTVIQNLIVAAKRKPK